MPLDVGKLRAVLELDRQGFSSDLGRARDDFRDFGRQVDQVADQSRQSINRLGQDVSSTGRDAGRDLGDGLGRGAQQGRQDVEAELDRLRREFDRLRQQAGQAGQDAGQDLGRGIRDGIDSGTDGAEGAGEEGGTAFVGGFGAIVARLGSAAGPIGLALASAAGLGTKFADMVLEGFDTRARQGEIKATFGFDQVQMAQAGKAASDAYVNAWGESTAANMRVAGIAIQSGILDGNATAEQMQPVIEQLNIVSTIMGEEIPAVARAAGQMVKTGMVDNVTEAFDLLTAGQQQGLNLSEDLLDTMVEYGTQFRKVGIDGADAMGLIKQAVAGGARDTDVAADAIKEFSLRVIDDSESTTEALTQMGLPVDSLVAQLKKGGPEARAGLDTIFDALRKLPPEVDKNAIAIALFGTQYEDLGGAFDTFNLDTAAAGMGEFGDATKRAGDDMSGTASSIEGAKRTIETSLNNMKADLSDAFGPAAEKLATWITEHEDEIVYAISTIGQGLGFAAAQATGFTGAMITGLGYVVKYLGDAGGFILDTFASIAGGIGNIVKEIPGMGDIGDSLVAAAKGAEGMADKFYGAGDGMIKFGRDVRDAGTEIAALISEIGNVPDNKPIKIDAPGGLGTLNLLRELGAKVTSDNDKNIVVEAPLAQPVLDKLRELGLEARTVDGKTVIVKLDDNEYNAKIAYVTNPVTKKVTIDWQNTDYRAAMAPGGPLRAGPGLPGPAGYFDGGWTGPGSKYQPAGIVHADEFVVRKDSRQAIESQYPGALDYMNAFGKLPGYADGGRVLDSLVAIQRQVAPALQLTSGVRNEPGSFHNTGEAGDFSNGSSNTPEMLSFARYMAANYGAALAELIHHNPAFSGQQIDEGKIVPDSFFAGAGDHTNHVHVAAHQPLPLPGATTAAPTGGGVQDIMLTPESSREDVARKIIAEGRKRGYTDEQIVAILATARGESNFNPNAIGGGGAWHGVFQQDSSYPGRDDPNQNIATFYDRLDAKAKSPGASDDMWKNIFWLQQAPGVGTADEAFATGRQGYMSEMRAHEGEASALLARLGPTVGGVAQPGTTGAPGSAGYTTDGSADTGSADTGSTRGAPPEDPYTTTLTFRNPLEPFWWKGEKEYRQRIIDDYEKRKAWEEYWSGDGQGGEKSKGKKVTVKSIDEATKDLEDAKRDLEITLQRQREQKPDSPQSSKMSMQKSVDDARDKVAEAEAALKLARENPQGFYYQPEAGQTGVPNGLPGPAKPFADGGWTGPGGRNDPAGVVHADEFVVRKDSRRAIESQYPGALDYMNTFGRLPGYADGGAVGFGGYVHDESDVMAPKNWRDWMGLATGAGFAAYNLFEPYVNAAVTGKVDLGNITPQLNTGTTDTGMVTGLVSNLGGQISDQLNEIIIALKEGKNITVKIDGIQDPFNAPQIAARRV